MKFDNTSNYSTADNFQTGARQKMWLTFQSMV